MIGPSDPMAWAKFPRNQVTMGMIREGAKKDRRIGAIYREHIAGRVCDDRGNLLKFWDGATWQPVEKG
ncbi:MAG: hypothetical protein ABTS16_21115 [Candidatus Accumulibacter phosphatis]|uniref:DUF2510 domain-containing protein n=1 Tax=Candidatus Accumulibacter contiguus TaxID=2954381 RepID=A0ABX1T6I2_9PROT|nr:hypothetical protein [Candidatus Accumulibacter contiguus]NMQ05254.1 hypothetical protein [Candidatus Accumulibacter contiguus]